jgi:tetratricopeptide (TPR) repeat protein
LKGVLKRENEDFKAGDLIFLGSLYCIFSKYDSAVNYANQSLLISRHTGNLVNLGYGYSLLGYTYSSKGEYSKAIENYLIGEKYFRQTGFELAYAYNLNNIACAYQEIEDYKSAIKYLEMQLPISLKLNDLYSLIGCYHEFGNISVKQKKFNDALAHYRLAYNESIELNNASRIDQSYGMLGDAFEGLMQFDSAFHYFRKALEANKKSGFQYGYSLNLISIARTLKNMPDGFIKGEIKTVVNVSNKNQKAKEFALEALQLVRQSGELDLQKDVYEILSELYEKENDPVNALKFHKQFVAYKDSIVNAENSKYINNLEYKIERENKDRQIVLLNKDREIQQQEIKKQKIVRNSFVAGFLLILLLVGVLYNLYRVKKKSNKQLSQALNELGNAQQQLVKNEKMAAFGVLASRVAHEIQNPLNFVNNFSDLSEEMILEILDSKNEPERNEITNTLLINIKKISHHGRRADAIIKDLQQHSRSGTAHEYFEMEKPG